MRYTPELEARIVAQIRATPDAPVILPEWASWKGLAQPRVYIDRLPEPLIRHLHEVIVGPLEYEQNVVNLPGVDQRNVNPLLGAVVPSRRAKAVCRQGHRYTPEDWIPGVGHRCHACAEQQEKPKPNHNAAKTHCPQNHPYTKGNTIKLKSGRRRCRICTRDQSAAWRKRQKEQS